ncbi:GAF domain-containing protein [Mastigocoleus testarum]|uniref:ATP-binding protein n=1 Tax=Mastigocoleus testarum BC008 TaxID=371196 RepID=A0A0V7ZYZ2_9CYAN|nr:GAF domain-containing protein [Mastigocoleus testarum]KST67559.1 ATP-binding protein [Mastigocoleus testarum BC008]KST69805.1 ATP-binding protein [Mastigocoleus testarum BC008]
MVQLNKITTEQKILSLGRILQNLREEDNVDALIEKTVSFFQEYFQYSLIWVALYDRLNHILFGKGGITPGNETKVLQQRLVLSPGDLLEQVTIEQRPLGVADLRLETRAEEWQELAEKHNLKGTVILPIRYRDCCLGIVLMASERWGYLLSSEIKVMLMTILGELGTILYHHEVDLFHKQTKHPDEPLLELLQSLPNLNDFEQRLEAVVHTTHDFISPSRTNIYWFERKGNYFWQRKRNQGKKLGLNALNKHGIPAQTQINAREFNDFYYTLSGGHMIFIGDGKSSLNSYSTTKLLKQLQARSLLAAPIIWQKELLGFLAVENKEPRIWAEAEQNFIRGAAGLISLNTPVDSMENTIQQVKEHARITTGMLQGIYQEQDIQDIQKIFSDAASTILGRLDANRFLVLQLNSERDCYQILYQGQRKNQRILPVNITFEALREVDRQLLEYQKLAVGIENLEEDLCLFNWRTILLSQGVRSLLIANCTPNRFPNTLLIVTTDINRYWSNLEKELIQAVSRQIGTIVRQWQLNESNQQKQHFLDSLGKSLRILGKTQHIPTLDEELKETLEKTGMEQIASFLNAPLVLLLSWMPGEEIAKITPGVVLNNKFAISQDAIVKRKREVLIELALANEGMLSLSIDKLPGETKKWLHGSHIAELLIMTLDTGGKGEPSGVLVIADEPGRQWSRLSLDAVSILIQQLAWSRRQQQITQLLTAKAETLEQLNWYKHRRLEESHRTVAALLAQIKELGITGDELTHMRYQQLLHQLEQTTASVNRAIAQEQWELMFAPEKIPMASILKRSLERIDSLLKQQKLWIGVHGLGKQFEENSPPETKTENYQSSPQSLIVAGDTIKIELAIYEILLAVCYRSITNGRIDIWCRPINEKHLEVSITDNGRIEEGLLEELEGNNLSDILVPSETKCPPGLHLQICKKLIQQLGGELHFYQLADSRLVSRLVLPLATKD